MHQLHPHDFSRAQTNDALDRDGSCTRIEMCMHELGHTGTTQAQSQERYERQPVLYALDGAS